MPSGSARSADFARLIPIEPAPTETSVVMMVMGAARDSSSSANTIHINALISYLR